MRTLILLSVLTLSVGCATTTATREGPAERAGKTIDDAAITASVNTIIVADSDAQFFKIDVTTMSGEVTLQGLINSRASEARLLEKIRALDGVRSVRSMLKVEVAS
ncbi:MAG: BON domain-containing protein [Archangium sp.]